MWYNLIDNQNEGESKMGFKTMDILKESVEYVDKDEFLRDLLTLFKKHNITFVVNEDKEIYVYPSWKSYKNNSPLRLGGYIDVERLLAHINEKASSRRSDA